MLLDAQALLINPYRRKQKMNNRIPENIVNGVTAMLSPYCSGLTAERLLSAIGQEKQEVEVETLLTRKEAAEALKVSIPTVDRCLRDGVLPKRCIRGAVRIPSGAVAGLISSRS